LLTLPVRNGDIIVGKFLAVSTIAVASAVLNLISMLFIGLFFYSSMQTDSSQSLSINLVSFIPALFIILLCVIAFAFFMSAITMCVSTFAKSFKEANNYQTPLLLVIMLASFVTFVPNIEFTSLLAAVPVVNICLLLMNILVFKYNFSLIIIVLITNIAYAAIAILFLIKIYNSEEMLFGEGGVSLQLFTNRKHLKKCISVY
jgi:sodium transport system permease protein